MLYHTVEPKYAILLKWAGFQAAGLGEDLYAGRSIRRKRVHFSQKRKKTFET